MLAVNRKTLIGLLLILGIFYALGLNARLMCQRPEVTYLQTRRKAMSYPFVTNTLQVIRTIEENQIDYIIVDAFGSGDEIPGAETYLKPVVEKCPENSVYQVNPEWL